MADGNDPVEAVWEALGRTARVEAQGDEEGERGDQAKEVLYPGGLHRLGGSQHQGEQDHGGGHVGEGEPLEPTCPAERPLQIGGKFRRACPPHQVLSSRRSSFASVRWARRKRSSSTSQPFSPSGTAITCFSSGSSMPVDSNPHVSSCQL